MRTSVKIGERYIGDGLPCFITFECGPTHNGLESAKRLIEHAASANADAVKFQIFDADRLVAEKDLTISYKVLVDKASGETEVVSEPIYNVLERRSLSRNEWREVKQHCDDHGLAFFATVGFDEDIDFLQSLGCQSIKIASPDINHLPLLRKAAKADVSIQLDTGRATLGEVERAIDVIRENGNNNIIIHNCPSGYPARLESINLRIISTLRSTYSYPIAFSDHTPGWDMDMAAIALGANLVEKTITEDRTYRSVEHIMSLEPDEMKEFVHRVRELEVAMGDVRRIVSEEERELRKRGRRSAYLIKSAKKGTPVEDLSVEYSRPGYGISPDEFERIDGLLLASDISAGARLSYDDFTSKY